ncbi:MAG: cell division protein FtsA [Firmicutes bacterium]|uniref:Cell division protein FtsA n=1 Tax=Melghirimyces thermohalophilus TaxID=1236220 RepID=A0A1G6HR91_9BACL|nr:cell division protein FtsA [Melghirimyces thermohalophilus]MDA8354422.1 cell division protein FtsA [Bacillota bacterium]SDB96789.1 cell division protein FtsA [Melghirimyces thermohalophilus]
MSSGEYIVSLDIGTSKVRVIVAEVTRENTQIVGVGSAVSKGTKKGAIIDIDQAVQSIREAIDHAERMVGIDISNVFVGISGHHVALQSSHGVVAVSGENKEIGQEDIDRVMQAARVVALPPERAVVEVVPKQFVVDGLREIQDPHGMVGVRLEVEATIVTGAKTIIHNVLRCVEKADLSVAGIILLPLAAGEICLSTDERNMGVVLADIGGGTTSLAVYEQGHLSATSVLPIGGEYITHDIAYGLRTQTETAEKLKRKYGVALVEEANEEITFEVQTIGSHREKTVSQKELGMIIEPRVEEIFQLIRDEVESMGYVDEPAGGYVLTGGVMSIPHALGAARNQLGQAVRMVSPRHIGVEDPSFTSGVGMIHYIRRRFLHRLPEGNGQQRSSNKKGGHSTWMKLKNFFGEFI